MIPQRVAIPTRGLAESEHGSEGPSDICRVLPGLDRALCCLCRLRNQRRHRAFAILHDSESIGFDPDQFLNFRFGGESSAVHRSRRNCDPIRIRCGWSENERDSELPGDQFQQFFKQFLQRWLPWFR